MAQMPPAGFDISIVRELGCHAAAWDELVAHQPLPSPFLRSWFLEHGCSHEPLFVLVIADRLVGGLALEEDRRLGISRLLAAGSALGPDHVDIVAAPGLEGPVAAAVAAWFCRRGERLIDVTLAPAESRLAAAIGAQSAIVEAAPYTPLEGDFDTFLAARSSQLRNTLAKSRRRLANDGVRYVRAPSSEVERSIDALRDLHREVFGDISFFLPEHEAFARVARAGVAAGEAAFHQLRRDDDIIATVATFEVAGRVSYYQTGRRTDHRWRGSGGVIEAHVIEDAFARGMTEFDHLRGQEAYKTAWAPHLRPLTRVTATHGVSARAAAAAIPAARRAGAWARHSLAAKRIPSGVPS